jgi:hypothetical protein
VLVQPSGIDPVELDVHLFLFVHAPQWGGVPSGLLQVGKRL